MSGALATKNATLWERDPLDWYVEPVAATEALLSVERFVGSIWDPACGQGNIVETLIAAGYRAYGTDLKRRTTGVPWFLGEHDFLDFYQSSRVQPFSGEPFPNICINPPFFRAKGAEAFIRRALELAPGKVCVFVDIRFIAGDERAQGLYAEFPPHRIWVVTPRVSCPPGDYLAAGNKAGNGSSDWCWLVWDRTAPFTATQFGWLRRAA